MLVKLKKKDLVRLLNNSMSLSLTEESLTITEDCIELDDVPIDKFIGLFKSLDTPVPVQEIATEEPPSVPVTDKPFTMADLIEMNNAMANKKSAQPPLKDDTIARILSANESYDAPEITEEELRAYSRNHGGF